MKEITGGGLFLGFVAVLVIATIGVAAFNSRTPRQEPIIPATATSMAKCFDMVFEHGWRQLKGATPGVGWGTSQIIDGLGYSVHIERDPNLDEAATLLRKREALEKQLDDTNSRLRAIGKQ